jgi:microcystin degradation protein MlrC
MKRVALLGFSIECNRWGERATEADFAAEYLFRGAALMQAIRAQPPAIAGEIRGFCASMDAAGPWRAVPLTYAASHPKGPVADAFVARISAEFREGLAGAGPLDGVYVVMHGAALAESDDDPDGALLAEIRAVVGPDVPIVATFDLHANVSERMVASVDAFIGYRTNPHVDHVARGAEAAAALHAIWNGARIANALVRLPLVPPTLTMRTEAGSGPFADLMGKAAALIGHGALTASVMGSFPQSDTADNGVAIIIGTDRNPDAAQSLALGLARAAWEARDGYRIALTSVDAACAAARAVGDDATLPAVILADLGDNPGGGAPGTTTGLLAALLDTNARGFVFGLLHDPGLAERASAAGPGGAAEMQLVPFGGSPERTQAARVVCLHGGDAIGRRGLLADCPIRLGPSALLAIGEGHVVVTTHRVAANDPVCFEMFGLDLAAARAIIVKSRGHFRAGFDEYATGAQVLEVDTPGITSPNLAQFAWTKLPRPSWPLDPDTVFSPRVVVSGRGL